MIKSKIKYVITLIVLVVLLRAVTVIAEEKIGTSELDVDAYDDFSEIMDIAENSECYEYEWKDRGLPAGGYLKGMAIAYARAYCNPEEEYVMIASAYPKRNSEKTDVLSWYSPVFRSLDMNDNLRNTYTALIGLGVRESSGGHCCGRDMTADYSTADSAEAGLFQASWGVREVAPELLTDMFEKYKSSEEDCFLSVFEEGTECEASDATNWGHGEGVKWQKITKACPMFAIEFATVIVRLSGGSEGEFGPLRRKEAEIRPECSDMLKEVESFVDSHKEICDLF